MSFATALFPRALIRLFAAAISVALLAAHAPAVLAQEEILLPSRKLDRKFPQGQFCALKVDLPFTTNATSCRVEFEAKRYTLATNGVTLLWTEQYIDNVVLSEAVQYDANFGPPPTNGNSEFCYNGDPLPTPYFYFNRPGLVLPLKDLFDTGAGSWDLTQGAYFAPNHSAPRNPELDNDETGGSLGLGLESGSPSLSDIATTSVAVNGLVAGIEYNLSAWWEVNAVIFGSTYEYLTITVYGPGGTPIARRSWGGVKNQYK